MSCVAAIGSKREQVWAAAACKKPLPFSSPPVTHTKVRRLYDMSVSCDPKIRAVAAGHPDTPEDALWELADDEDYNVRAWVTRNPHVTNLILGYMADNDRDGGIRLHAHFRLSVLG